MKKNIMYFRKFLREAGDASRAFNGGDYSIWVVVAVDEDGKTISGRYNTTADFDACRGCGRFTSLADDHDCTHYMGPLYDGGSEWEDAEVYSLYLFLPV